MNMDAQHSGAAFVYTRTGTTWTRHAYIKASNTDELDFFGASVALSGDTLVIGAVGEDSSATGADGDQSDDSVSNAGAVYVFTRSGSEWTQQAYLKASASGSKTFGTTVSLATDWLAVGATSEDSDAVGVNGDESSNDAANSGAVYLLRRSGSAWSQVAYVKASNTGSADLFGAAVVITNDQLVVAAPFEDSDAQGFDGTQASNAALESGAFYIFR
jgi:hypothetical protein